MHGQKFSICCPYCGKGDVRVSGELVMIHSTGQRELEPLSDDSSEPPRQEADTSICEHFIAARVLGYIDEEWHTERLPWLRETGQSCRAMCLQPDEYLAGIRANYALVRDSLDTADGSLLCSIIFAREASQFVREVLPRMFRPVTHYAAG